MLYADSSTGNDKEDIKNSSPPKELQPDSAPGAHEKVKKKYINTSTSFA